MRIQMKEQITINASASEVWRVLAHDFEYIDRWSSGITKSKATTAGTVPEGAKICGRVCDKVEEEFTHYDEQAKRFGYKATEPPWFIRSVRNNWSVRSLEPNKSVVEMKPEIDFNFFVGLFLIPTLKIWGGVMIRHTFEELKHYIEQGQPHPRKQKALLKQMKNR